MVDRIVTQPLAFGAEHQRRARVGDRVLEHARCLAVEADAPEARVADLAERACEVDDAHPRHRFKRAARGTRQCPRLAGRMAVLRHQRDGAERRRRAQYRADIVRIGDLIEDDQRPGAGQHEDVAEIRRNEFLDFKDDALVRCVGGDQPPEIGIVAILHDEAARQLGLHDEILRRRRCDVEACESSVRGSTARRARRDDHKGAETGCAARRRCADVVGVPSHSV